MMVTDCGRGHFCVLKILTFNLEDSRHIFVYPPKITSHPFSVPHRLIFFKKKVVVTLWQFITAMSVSSD